MRTAIIVSVTPDKQLELPPDIQEQLLTQGAKLMRVVIDTNVWISGLLFGGNPQKIMALGKSKKITICCSNPLINEIIE